MTAMPGAMPKRRPAPAQPAPDAPRQITVGRITVRMIGPEMFEMVRIGSVGVCRTQREILWGRETIENAMITAQRRNSIDAREQVKALRWALDQLPQEKGGRA